MSGKSKDEQMAEKKQELEKRLQDVTGQLGSAKKAAKKGKHFIYTVTQEIYGDGTKFKNRYSYSRIVC